MDDKRDTDSIIFFNFDIFFNQCIGSIPPITLNGKTFKISSCLTEQKKFAPFKTTISAFNTSTQKNTSFPDIGWDDLFEIIKSLLSGYDSSLLAGVGISLSINKHSIRYRLTRELTGEEYRVEKLEYIRIQEKGIWKTIQQDKKEYDDAIFPILNRVLEVQRLFQRISDRCDRWKHTHVYWNQLDDEVNKPRVASWIKRPEVENGIQYRWRYLDNESQQWYDVLELDQYVPEKLLQKFPQPSYFFLSSLPKSESGSAGPESSLKKSSIGSSSILPMVAARAPAVRAINRSGERPEFMAPLRTPLVPRAMPSKLAVAPQVSHTSPLLSQAINRFNELCLTYIKQYDWINKEQVDNLLNELLGGEGQLLQEQIAFHVHYLDCISKEYIVTDTISESELPGYASVISQLSDDNPGKIIIIPTHNANHFVIQVFLPGKEEPIIIDPIEIGIQSTDGMFCGIYVALIIKRILEMGWEDFEQEYLTEEKRVKRRILMRGLETRLNQYPFNSDLDEDAKVIKVKQQILCWLSIQYINLELEAILNSSDTNFKEIISSASEQIKTLSTGTTAAAATSSPAAPSSSSSGMGDFSSKKTVKDSCCIM